MRKSNSINKKMYEFHSLKQTEIVAVIEYEGKVKSGGYVKYNIAQVVNNSLKSIKFSISR